MINELNKPYIARINTEGTIKLLGTFSNSKDAHRAWQLAKIEVINEAALQYKFDVNFIEKVYIGILSRVDKLSSDYQNKEVTEWL